MTALYAIALGVGAISIIAWVAMVAVAETVEGWEHVDPDRRFGGRGRTAVAATAGFGLAGMSSSFGGWPTFLSFVAAVAAAVVVGALSTRLTVERRRDDS